jgi:hypothetical protein
MILFSARFGLETQAAAIILTSLLQTLTPVAEALGQTTLQLSQKQQLSAKVSFLSLGLPLVLIFCYLINSQVIADNLATSSLSSKVTIEAFHKMLLVFYLESAAQHLTGLKHTEETLVKVSQLLYSSVALSTGPLLAFHSDLGLQGFWLALLAASTFQLMTLSLPKFPPK